MPGRPSEASTTITAPPPRAESGDRPLGPGSATCSKILEVFASSRSESVEILARVRHDQCVRI